MQLEIFYLQLESNNQTTRTGGDLESLAICLKTLFGNGANYML